MKVSVAEITNLQADAFARGVDAVREAIDNERRLEADMIRDEIEDLHAALAKARAERDASNANADAWNARYDNSEAERSRQAAMFMGADKVHPDVARELNQLANEIKEQAGTIASQAATIHHLRDVLHTALLDLCAARDETAAARTALAKAVANASQNNALAITHARGVAHAEGFSEGLREGEQKAIADTCERLICDFRSVCAESSSFDENTIANRRAADLIEEWLSKETSL